MIIPRDINVSTWYMGKRLGEIKGMYKNHQSRRTNTGTLKPRKQALVASLESF